MARTRLGVALLLMAMGVVGTQGVLAQSDSTSHVSKFKRVRGVSPSVSSLIEQGVACSPAVAALVAEIAKSDIIVYVERAKLDWPVRATTQLVTATSKHRFLRIRLQIHLPEDDLIPLLAHELQHAVEVAHAPQVRSQEALRQLYQRIGFKAQSRDSYDTDRARIVENLAKEQMLVSVRKARK